MSSPSAPGPSQPTTTTTTLRTKRIHRNDASWKKDIDLLICILRLRCQPLIPYPLIASYLLSAFTIPILRRAGFHISAIRNIPQGFDVVKETAGWMETHLPEIFEGEERVEGKIWKRAKGWDEGSVEEMLRISELDEEGYRVVGREEMELQIEWRRRGDWRAGSVPWEPEELRKKSLVDSGALKRGSVDLTKETIRLLRPNSEIWRPVFGRKERSRTVGSEDTVLFRPPQFVRRDAAESKDFPNVNTGFPDHQADPFSHQPRKFASISGYPA
jgi:hypothetical protein